MPAVPTIITVANNSTTDSLDFSFKRSSDDDGTGGDTYDIRYSTAAQMTSPTTHYDYITATGANNYSGTTPTSLSSGTTYYFQVRFKDKSARAHSSWADAAGQDYATTDSSAAATPDAPTNVSADTVTNNSIAYSWTAPSQAVTGYKLYYGTSSNPTVPGSTQSGTTYTRTSLAAGTTYYFRVKAYNSSASPTDSQYSSTVTQITIPADPGIPEVDDKDDDSVEISWDTVTGATIYQIFAGAGNTGVPTYLYATVTTSGPTGFYTFSGLPSGTVYSVRLKSKNDGGISDYGLGQITATTTVKPDTPVLSDNKPTRNDIAWTAPTGTDESYLVAGTSTNPTTIISTQSGTGAKTFEHTGLTPGDEYFYRVRTATEYADGFYSDYSSNVSATNPSLDLPTSIAYEALSTTDVRFSFAEPATWGTRVYVYNSSGTQAEKGGDDWLDVDNSGTTTFDASDWWIDISYPIPFNSGTTQNTALNVGEIKFKTYYDGAYSAFTSTITGYTLPGPPTSVTATDLSDSEIQLSWTDPAGSALSEEFEIDHRIDDTGDWVSRTTTATGTSYIDDNLVQGTAYYYRIRTKTDAGYSTTYDYANDTTQTGPDPVAGDALGLGQLGYATGVNGDATSETSISACNGGATTEVTFKDFYCGAVGSLSGTQYVWKGSSTYFTANFSNKGTLFNSRIGIEDENFTWVSSNTNIATVETNADRTCLVTTTYAGGTATITMTYAGIYNQHSGMENGNQSRERTITGVG
jgi:titin